MLSQRIEFEKLSNTRDLGGMTGADGRKVLPGKLYRSGHLFAASSKDLEKLAELIELSIDFRSNQECQEKPEPAISGVKYCHLPILDERRSGVTRDKESFAEVREKMVQDEGIALKYMSKTYDGFITNEHSVSQYERFAHMLLENHSKGILWHCTAGKDRAGFATVIVQELLGISRQDIIEDYLYTNVCLAQEIKDLTAMILSMPGIKADAAVKAVNFIFAANIEFINTAYAAVEEHYGTFENYLREALHVTPEEQEKIRDIYLSKA